jgi:hypothetical protein
LLEEQKKGINLRLPREFDNNLESPLWEKLLLMHHSALGVPTSGILKNRVAAITEHIIDQHNIKTNATAGNVAPMIDLYANAILGTDPMATFAAANNGPIVRLSFVTTDNHHHRVELSDPRQGTVPTAVGFVVNNDHFIIGRCGAVTGFEGTRDTQIAATFNHSQDQVISVTEWQMDASSKNWGKPDTTLTGFFSGGSPRFEHAANSGKGIPTARRIMEASMPTQHPRTLVATSQVRSSKNWRWPRSSYPVKKHA